MGFRCAYVLYYHTEPAQSCYTVVLYCTTAASREAEAEKLSEKPKKGQGKRGWRETA